MMIKKCVSLENIRGGGGGEEEEEKESK